VAECPVNSYFSSSSQTCQSCTIPNCLACSSGAACQLCSSGLVPNAQFQSCICPPRGQLNTATSTCSPCPFDCYTCASNGDCLTCNATTDFRQLSGNRCVPVPGYYEGNTTVATPCMLNCAACTSGSDCSSCLPRFVLAASSPPSCSPCPFDCLSCGNDGSCFSCSAQDHRQLSGSRCVPQAGYFETNQSLAGTCSTGCSLCTSASSCSQCQASYTLLNGICSNSTCSANCLNCLSAVYCYYCVDRAVFDYAYFTSNYNLRCKVCPYDCQTCY
jgi:hypothetical protein